MARTELAQSKTPQTVGKRTSVNIPQTENSLHGLHHDSRNGRRNICHSANIKQKLMAASRLRAPLMQSDVTRLAMETAAQTQAELASAATEDCKIYVPNGRFKGSDVNMISSVELS